MEILSWQGIDCSNHEHYELESLSHWICSLAPSLVMVISGTRWKGKDSEAWALANPMSKIVSELQSSLVQSKASGLLLDRVDCCVVLIEVGLEQARLLNQACFGNRIITTNKDKHQYEMSLEEAFYLCDYLKCFQIVREDKCVKNNDELWELLKSRKKVFPIFYKAYSHLRAKNWVVREEIKYGVHFVAYHHHPCLVHSEYAVIVSEGDGNANKRLMAWPSLHATIRLEDGVAKKLLVLYINKSPNDVSSSSSLEYYTVEEQIISRLNPDKCHEDHTAETENCCDSVHYIQSSPHYHFNKLSTQNLTQTFPPLMTVGLNTRWKRKGLAIAHANPMSELITRLQSFLLQSKACGVLAGCAIILEVGIKQADLLNRTCFGCPIVTDNEDSQLYELSFEEAFYLCHSLNCIKIARKNQCFKNNDEIWEMMKTRREVFPIYYKAYSHLRDKNWVVRSGIQYGVDFVAYRHHPSLVHSEYAVIVSEGNGNRNTRLLTWPDVHATVRLEGGVAKTLLVLHIKENDYGAVGSACYKQYTVEEQTVTRWNSERCREDKNLVKV